MGGYGNIENSLLKKLRFEQDSKFGNELLRCIATWELGAAKTGLRLPRKLSKRPIPFTTITECLASVTIHRRPRRLAVAIVLLSLFYRL